jgi:pimeloyl-ACP methyl ester carboxylesterase
MSGLPAGPAEVAVLVPGLRLPAASLWVLGRRLRRCGIAENGAALARFVLALGVPVVHLIGHSLGGRVILEALDGAASLPPGRLVLLATPCRRSVAARRYAGTVLGRRLLGQARAGLLEDARLPPGRQVGSIAGTLGIGAGWWTGLARPSDGTVAVAETRLEGMSACLSLPVSHTGMLLSRRVAKEVCAFLRAGRFASGD